jgi:hypothetical protein
MSETEQELELTEPGETPFEEPAPETEEEEAAQTEEETPAEPEPEPEPEGLSPEQIEAIFKKIERAYKAYTAKIGDALGDDAPNFIPCPVCSDGVPSFVDQRQIGQFPDNVRREVMRFLGFAIEQDYDASRSHQTCPQCSGKGKVTTGSLVAGHETIVCSHCKGYGYFPPPTASGNGYVAPDALPASAEPLTEVMPQENVDEWGEPLILPDGRENPNYGRMPHRKVLVEPYGVTANLRAEPEYVPVEGEVIA